MKLAMLLASIIPLLFVATNVEAHSGHSPGNMPKPDGADDPDQLWGWGAVVGTCGWDVVTTNTTTPRTSSSPPPTFWTSCSGWGATSSSSSPSPPPSR